MKGLLIVIEGIGGVGKSTVKEKMTDLFRGQGFEVVLTREPGGTPAAEHLRELVRKGFPMDDRPFDPMGVALLFNAARADHMSKVIQPALDAGKIVLCDRFCDSTFTYQNIYNGVEMHKLVDLHELVIDRYPHMTFLLDAPAEVAMTRISGWEKDNDQFDRAGAEMQEKMRQKYLELAASDVDRYEVIDATQPPEEVFVRMLPQLRRLSKLHKGESVFNNIVPGRVVNNGIKDHSVTQP